MSDLLLQSTPELLEGWEGPVVFVMDEPTIGAAIERLGIWWVGEGYWFEPQGDMRQLIDGDVYLDMARAECRDRVARVVAERIMSDDPTRHAGVYWWSPPPHEVEWRDEDDPLRQVNGRPEWCLGARFGGLYGQYFVPSREHLRMVGRTGRHPDEDSEGTMPDPDWAVCAALADLDPNDNARLPDGSRLVDAQALLAVANQVLHG